jgi:hypothetical protein
MSKPCNRISGAVMAEMAIILPFLVLMVFGITELGRALYQENTLAKAVEAGGRYLGRAYGALDANCEPVDEDAWNEIKLRAANLIIYGDENGGATPLLPGLALDDPDGITIRGPESLSDTITPACVISVKAHADFDSLFGEGRIAPMLNFDLTLHAATEERWIGE